ncbi:MAG: hypothetical protein WDM92_11765 [Caulobacteraceae bacterium]
MALRKVSLLVFAAAGLAMAACRHDEERAGVASGFRPLLQRPGRDRGPGLRQGQQRRRRPDAPVR